MELQPVDEATVTINLSDQPNGIYIATIQTGTSMAVIKLIKTN